MSILLLRDPKRQIETLLRYRIAEKYDGTVPVRVTIRTDVLMMAFGVELSVPGQERIVPITHKQVYTFYEPATQEQIVDEVLFAIFLLLDEDDEEV